MTQRLKASRRDGSALIRMRGMAASFWKCEMAVNVSESGVKRPGVGDELVSCHRRHLCRTWDQVLVHSQRYDTGGLRRNRKKLFDGWRTGTGLLPWQQPSSAASFACLQSEKLWLQTWCLQDVVTKGSGATGFVVTFFTSVLPDLLWRQLRRQNHRSHPKM